MGKPSNTYIGLSSISRNEIGLIHPYAPPPAVLVSIPCKQEIGYSTRPKRYTSDRGSFLDHQPVDRAVGCRSPSCASHRNNQCVLEIPPVSNANEFIITVMVRTSTYWCESNASYPGRSETTSYRETKGPGYPNTKPPFSASGIRRMTDLPISLIF